MKLRVEKGEFQGKETQTVVVTKWNEEKEFGLKSDEYIHGKIKFKPSFGTRDAVIKVAGKDKQIKSSWMFLAADILSPGLEQYKNEYGNVKLNLGQCKGASDTWAVGDEFVVSLIPYLDKEGKKKKVLTMEKYEPLTEKGQKIANYVKTSNISYEGTISIKDTDGTQSEKKIQSLIPHYAVLM
jgi:hypothetical protein